MNIGYWLVEVLLEALIPLKWLTDGNRDRLSPWIRARRKAGAAVLAVIGMMALSLLWMAVTPAAGDAPYLGVLELIHLGDLVMTWGPGIMMLIAVSLNVEAWQLRPDRRKHDGNL